MNIVETRQKILAGIIWEFLRDGDARGKEEFISATFGVLEDDVKSIVDAGKEQQLLEAEDIVEFLNECDAETIDALTMRDCERFSEAADEITRLRETVKELKWNTGMSEAPLGTPIQLKQGAWVCTGILRENADPWTDGDTILHYNGTVLQGGFHGVWDGWKPLPAPQTEDKGE